MELKDFISFRKKIQNHETTGFGFKGDMKSINSDDAELLKLFDLGEVREVYYLSNNTDVDFENAVLGQDVCIAIDLSFFRSYYETFQDFIRSNKTHFPADPFYIHEFEYLHGENELISQIRNFITISDILSFISSLSKHEINSYGTLELIFQKPDDVRSIKIDYDVDAIENLNIRTSVKELEDHVFEDPGQETKKRMFSNEMINVLSKKECSFNCLLNAWDKINQSYKNSYENYLADFSFEKIKTSSHEHFHELTDRIYSTINKFSTYILAIPIAYIFILRFFDFDGKSCPKDSFLLVVGILYYLLKFRTNI